MVPDQLPVLIGHFVDQSAISPSMPTDEACLCCFILNISFEDQFEPCLHRLYISQSTIYPSIAGWKLRTSVLTVVLEFGP
jgi:hypothetical protein